MNMNEKELNDATLDHVAGGAAQPLGVFRCTVCGWEWPRESTNYPKPPHCQKCGAPMRWHMTREA